MAPCSLSKNKTKHNFNKIMVNSVTLCDQQQILCLLASCMFRRALERRNMIKGTTFINLYPPPAFVDNNVFFSRNLSLLSISERAEQHWRDIYSTKSLHLDCNNFVTTQVVSDSQNHQINPVILLSYSRWRGNWTHRWVETSVALIIADKNTTRADSFWCSDSRLTLTQKERGP